LQETEAWDALAASTGILQAFLGIDIARFEAFLQKWPHGRHAAEAKARIAERQRGWRSDVLLAARGIAFLAVFGGLLMVGRTFLT
jgi:hypothetical protein